MTAAPRELGNSRIATVRAPVGGVTAWSGVQIGYLFGVAVEDQPVDGGPVPLAVQGVWELPKEVGLHLDTGDVAYWDQANACVTNMHTGNLAIGVCVYDAKDPKDVIDVFLAPSIPDAGGQERIELVEQILVETRVAFHGAVLRTTDDPDTDIGAGWQPLDNFDLISITPRGCTLSLNGEFVFDRIGAWELVIGFNMSHNESNSGRETNLRLYNVTEATPGQAIPIAIGRNQPGTNYYTSLPFTLLAGEEGDTYRVEIGGGDTLSSVVWNSKQITLRYLGEVGGLVDPTP